MPELNKNSSREEIRAYIANIMQREKKMPVQKARGNYQTDVQTLKTEMVSQIRQKNKSDDKELIEFDNLKTKVLKYIVYKKRTEKEVRQKFSSSSTDANLLEDVIENLKENDKTIGARVSLVFPLR